MNESENILTPELIEHVERMLAMRYPGRKFSREHIERVAASTLNCITDTGAITDNSEMRPEQNLLSENEE